ncbi:MAG TPA: RNA methyltransferase [Acidimicrobiales bacterium]|nr:RNA methyltransferase [Acidimicrobiales bacterium]
MLVVEGLAMAELAAQAGWRVEAVFVPAGTSAPGGVLGDVPCYELAPGVLERVATTDTPQPLLAVVEYRPRERQELTDAGFVVAAAGLADPGNLGTVLRTAEAAGVDAVVLTPDTVDATNPKVVRASAGALFHVPLVDQVELGELRALGLRVLGTSSRAGTPYTETDFTGRVAIAVGNEARGLPDDAPVDGWVTIPHAGRAESLNAAMAAAVVCFEAARQRR